MMKKTNKKRGFTIIELTIVVAVIAILSAVLIPTFAGIIRKSRESADQQAVRNMNTVLSAAVLDEDSNIYDVYEALNESNIDADNYKPLFKDRFFFYDGAKQQVVYTDSDYKILYPEHLAKVTTEADRAKWISLSGTIKEVNVKDVEITGNTAKIEEAEELVAVFNAINDKDAKVKDVNTIELPASLNLMGAELNTAKVTTLTVKGPEAGATLSGVVNLDAVRENDSNGAGTGRNYFAGLVGLSSGDVTFENITIENSTFGCDTATMVGIFVGHAQGGTVTLKNVQVNNVTVRAMMKAGAFVGQLSNGANLVVDSTTTVSNVSVSTSAGFVGKFIGLAINKTTTTAPTVTVANAATLAGGITATLVKNASVEYITIGEKEYATDMDVKNGVLSIANPKEYAATVANYGWKAVEGDSTVDYNGGTITLKYHDVAELAFN